VAEWLGLFRSPRGLDKVASPPSPEHKRDDNHHQERGEDNDLDDVALGHSANEETPVGG
jgi:hypothetical protein